MANFDTVEDLVNRVNDGLADTSYTFFSLEETVAALNEALLQVFQIIHAEHAGYFFNSTPESIALTPTTNFYTLTNQFAYVAQIFPSDASANPIEFRRLNQDSSEFRYLLANPTDTMSSDRGVFYFDVVNDKTLMIVPKVASSLNVTVYTVQEPSDMVFGSGTPPIKRVWRPLLVEYAVRKLKGKEETAEYTSHEALLKFMLENLSAYSTPRAAVNPSHVEAFNI